MNPSKPTKLNFDSLADSAGRLGDAAQTMEDGLVKLQATVTTESPWGADEAGTVFGMAYQMVLGHAMETYGSRCGQLVEAGSGLAEMAAEAKATDLAIEDLLASIAKNLGR
ncbi:hypothetical protein R8Z50_06765 [Longispora sp. K20-0274]|uniref:hypothetical protein n=1 Tax=Longispora sp. K20-0274 TaxID=3088255 RepID=UPI00399BA5A9